MKKMVSNLLSCVLQTLQALQEKTLELLPWEKECCNKWVPIIVANMNKNNYLFHNEIPPPHFQLFYFNDRLEFCDFFLMKDKND